MMWKSWNKADKTLFAAAVLFVFAMCVHLTYPVSIVAKGFLFCTEAALVGGIADWFAVTALFRKPLGFPYHTAILPRRRELFINASARTVQREFLSRKKIFAHVRNLNFFSMLLNWLSKKEQQEMLVHEFLYYVQRIIKDMDHQQATVLLSHWTREKMVAMPVEEIFSNGLQWLRRDQHDQYFLAHLSVLLKERVATPEVKEKFEQLMEDYQKEKLEGTLVSLFSGMAQAMNILNFSDAAELLQKKLMDMLDEISVDDSELQKKFLAAFYERTEMLLQDHDFQNEADGVRRQLVDELSLEEGFEDCIDVFCENFFKEDTTGENSLNAPLMEVFLTELRHCLDVLQKNDELQQTVEKFLYDLAARTALQAQAMIGTIVHSVLERLTDEQINSLVYDKVEPDLLWIRMNGSIVGASIGLCLFVLIQFM